MWNTVYCSDTTVCGYVTYVTLTPGKHRLYHSEISAHIGVSAYGVNRGNSYGYPGGLEHIHVADALTMRMLCGTQCIALTLQFVAM